MLKCPRKIASTYISVVAAGSGPVSDLALTGTFAEILGVITPDALAEARRRDPKFAAAIADAIQLAELDAEREECERSLIAFFIRAWREIGEPGEPEINWHHEKVAAYLEALARGDIRDEIINIPPRCTKSLMCTVCFPAWVWCQPPEHQGPLMGPHVKFFCLSYGATLAEDMAVKMRRLVIGEWYQRLWGERVQIQPDQAARSNFANTAGGERISSSIEGGILGRGGDIQIIDDPHHLKGAESDTQRRETLEGMRALTTRVTDPRRFARILVMQRLHQDDATNYALEHWRTDLVHLWFPMRFEANRICPADHREQDGQLLWPDVWTQEAVRQEERELGEYGTAGQLQQSPVPRGGGIIKREWWRLWPDDAEVETGFQAQYRCYFCKWEGERFFAGPETECPRCRQMAERLIRNPETSFRLLSVDTGIGDKEQNSWSAATLWGIWHGKDEAPRAMLMEAWRGRPMLRGGTSGQKGLVETIADMANRRLVDTVLIEKKTRGVDLYNELDRLMRDYPWSLEFFEPTGRGDKTMRLSATVPLFTNELVWAPAKKWCDLVIDEVCGMPFWQSDDLCDTTSAGLIWLRDTGRLSLSHEHAQERRRASVFQGSTGRFNARELYEGS